MQPRIPEIEPPVQTERLPEEDLDDSKVDDFESELKELGGEVIRCSEGDAANRIVGELYVLGASRVLTWGQVEPILFTVFQRLEEEFQVILPELPADGSRSEILSEYDQIEVGITGVARGICRYRDRCAFNRQPAIAAAFIITRGASGNRTSQRHLPEYGSLARGWGFAFRSQQLKCGVYQRSIAHCGH